MENVKTKFVVCVHADEAGDIEVRKVYSVLPDELAASRGYLRIVDESGEDYLYPEEFFAPVDLPENAARTLAALSSTPPSK